MIKYISMIKFRLRFIIRDEALLAQDLFDVLNQYKLQLELIDPKGPDVIVTGMAHDILAFKNAFSDGPFDPYHMEAIGDND